jgi:hypothetical protein
MKFDKDTLLKQRFWLLLALGVPLIVGAFFTLMTSVRGDINKMRSALESDLKNASPAGDIQNQKSVKYMKDKAEDMAKEEETVWARAYDEQKELYTWPKELEKDFHFTDGRFATDIKAERGKNTPPSGKNDDSHFYGTIKVARQDYIEVEGIVEQESKTKGIGEKEAKTKGTVQKESKIITFFKTKKIKVTIDSKDTDFARLEPKDQVAITYLKGKYFFDPLTDSEQDSYAAVYKNQFQEIFEQVDPVHVDKKKGILQGVVQFPNWVYKEGDELPPNAQFFRHVAKKWDINQDFSNEAWMAQEDLWVQREIYRIVREANDAVSKFTGKAVDGLGKTATFTNPYWELTMTAAGKKKLDVKIKNLLPRRQKLDLAFRLQLQKKVNTVNPEIMFIGGEPRGPKGSSDDTLELKYDVQEQAATGIYDVEQVINWETAAVKRIDHIALGSIAGGDCCHSHRTFPEGLKPFRETKGKEGAAPEKGPDGGKFPDPKMMMVQPKDFRGGKGGEANGTPHGLHADRYLEKPSRQTRQIPIGVALIVDQEHVDRVLLAFSKSKLRFRTTQVILNWYPHSVRPNVAVSEPKGKDFFKGKGFPGGEGVAPFGPFGGPLGGMRQPAPPSAGGEQEANMELVIYGIVTLYERYPPRKQGQ